MYKYMFFLILFYLTSTIETEHFSQQKILTLNNALEIALKESYSIQSAQLSLINSEKSLEANKLGMRTTVDFQIMPGYTSSLNSIYNTEKKSEEYYQIGKTSMESRFQISQPLIFTNGRFSITGSLLGRDQFSTGVNNTRDYYSNLSFNFRQPLLTYNSQKANLQRAVLSLEKLQRGYTKTEADIVFLVTSNYYRLLQSKKRLEIKQEEQNQKQVSYETAINKFKAGLIAEVEALQLEIELAASKNELLNASRTYNEMKDDFKLLIGIPLNEDIEVEDNIEFKSVIINKDSTIELALKNRPELFNSEVDIRLAQMQVEEAKYKDNISAELELNYGINKVDDKLNHVFRDFLDDRRINFTVSVPILDWGKNNREVESVEANLKLSKLTSQNQKASIINEISQIINKIESSKERVEILNKSVELAEKSYNISLERFRSGNITSFELSQTQLKLTNSKLDNLNALIEYKLAIADLRRKICCNQFYILE